MEEVRVMKEEARKFEKAEKRRKEGSEGGREVCLCILGSHTPTRHTVRTRWNNWVTLIWSIQQGREQTNLLTLLVHVRDKGKKKNAH